MPGFKVDGVGERASGRPRSYYSYTWEVPWIYGMNGLKEPLIYLRDATLPTVSFGKEVIKGSSLNYKFASDVTWEDVRLTWYDTVGLLGIMKEWRSKVWTSKEGLKHAADYKERTVLSSLLPEGGEENQWSLHNSWPSVIKHGDLTYTASDFKVVEVTLTYDWADEIPSPGGR